MDGVALTQATGDEVGDGRVKVPLDVLLVHDRVQRRPQEGAVLHLHLMQRLLDAPSKDLLVEDIHLIGCLVLQQWKSLLEITDQ